MRRARGMVAVGASIVALTTFGAPAAGGGMCRAYTPNEKAMARMVNGARSARGLPQLHLDPDLSRLARRHTGYMARSYALFHTRNLGRKVTNWSTLGENVGYGSGANQLHRLFMSSPGHRGHILNRSFRHFGVGMVQRSGYSWVTVIFEGRRNPGARLPAPSC